jgi:hypothetical protein
MPVTVSAFWNKLMDIQLGTLERLDPRTVWPSEATSFTPWLAKNIERLAKALELDIEVQTTEAAVGDFSCDIVGTELGRNRPIIIENQLEPTDHRHLGQLLTYAAGLDAAVVVWVSREVREEHRQAIDWLNRHTSDDIDFFAVVVELLRIGDSVPAVQFRPVAFPNAWSKKPAGGAAKSAPSEKGAAYQAFFQPVFDELRTKHAFTNAKAAQPQNWYNFKSGVTGIYYTATFTNGRRLRADLYIDRPEPATNKAIFDWLHAQRAEIEQRFGMELLWERLDHRRCSRIGAILEETDIEDAETRGDEMRTWLVAKLLQVKAVFGPLLPAAIAAAGATATAVQ